MDADTRRGAIVDAVRAHGPATVTELVDRLGQSKATIRRDLVLLDEQGLLRRVHGGARPVDVRDDVFADLAAQASTAKDAIARAAADLIHDGQSVLVDIGTTAALVARHLRGRPVTVLTRNLAVFAELVEDDVVELIMLGGTVRPHHRSLVGYLTIEALRQVRADTVLLGTSGIRRTGHSVDTVGDEVSVKRAMIGAADQVMLLADATKFPGSGTSTVCGPEAIATLITDTPPDPATAAALATAEVDVIVVPPR